ncbi:MAG: efflux RND transporter permease subunit [Pyrinomonadaceae bacterium]
MQTHLRCAHERQPSVQRRLSREHFERARQLGFLARPRRLAVAIGELVDDSIVDIENIFRRLRENRLLEQPKPALRVIYRASLEIRSSIVYATFIVALVFVPLFALTGIEGRLLARRHPARHT